MKSDEKIFGNLIKQSEFLQELKALFNLPKTTQQKLFETYISAPYRLYYCKHSDELAAIINTEDNVAHRLFHIFDFLAYNILSSNEPDEVIESLKPIFGNVDFEAIKEIFIQLKDQKTRNRLNIIDLIDDQIGLINPHMARIDYHLDQRIVFHKEEVVNKLPVILFQLKTRHEPEKKLVFELTEYDIDPFIRKLNSIKQELEKMKNSVK